MIQRREHSEVVRLAAARRRFQALQAALAMAS
jgi:hypothetical protein